MIKIQMPEPVRIIIEQLNSHGFEAFAVGGCVRDSFLGRLPKDWDITTSAKPEQIKDIFQKTVDTGILHGTVTVLMGHEGYEVTTYRIDGEYEDGRHPKTVEYTASLLEDLKRRDFTINAMAYSGSEGLVDEFGGTRDLESGIIRCVGDPMDRFREDALRILRAIRFSAQLGFQIEEETENAIAAIAKNLKNVSKERIQVELTKLLLSEHPDRMRLVFDNGIAFYITKHFFHTETGLLKIEKLNMLPDKKHMRWCGFMRFLSEREAVTILRELRLDNDTIDQAGTLARLWKKEIPADKPAIRKLMSGLPLTLFKDLLCFQKLYLEEAYQKQLKQVERYAEEIISSGDCIRLKDMAVSGRDLIAAGIKPGPRMGEVLQVLFDEVLKNPVSNDREILLKLIDII